MQSSAAFCCCVFRRPARLRRRRCASMHASKSVVCDSDTCTCTVFVFVFLVFRFSSFFLLEKRSSGSGIRRRRNAPTSRRTSTPPARKPSRVSRRTALIRSVTSVLQAAPGKSGNACEFLSILARARSVLVLDDNMHLLVYFHKWGTHLYLIFIVEMWHRGLFF